MPVGDNVPTFSSAVRINGTSPADGRQRHLSAGAFGGAVHNAAVPLRRYGQNACLIAEYLTAEAGGVVDMFPGSRRSPSALSGHQVGYALAKPEASVLRAPPEQPFGVANAAPSFWNHLWVATGLLA